MQDADDDSAQLAPLESAITEYVTLYPFAADTLDGVTNWWLMKRGINASSDMVLQALEKLVQSGLLDKKKLHDNSVIYTLSARKH